MAYLLVDATSRGDEVAFGNDVEQFDSGAVHSTGCLSVCSDVLAEIRPIGVECGSL